MDSQCDLDGDSKNSSKIYNQMQQTNVFARNVHRITMILCKLLFLVVRMMLMVELVRGFQRFDSHWQNLVVLDWKCLAKATIPATVVLNIGREYSDSVGSIVVVVAVECIDSMFHQVTLIVADYNQVLNSIPMSPRGMMAESWDFLVPWTEGMMAVCVSNEVVSEPLVDCSSKLEYSKMIVVGCNVVSL